MVESDIVVDVPVDEVLPPGDVDEGLVADQPSDPVADPESDAPAAIEPSQDIVTDIVQSVQDAIQDIMPGDADQPSDDAAVNDDTAAAGDDTAAGDDAAADDAVVDGVMSSYYGGYMSGYLSGLEDGAPDQESPPPELVDIQTFALSPIVSSSGLKGVILDVIGPYDNVVTQYKYQQANNSYYTYVNEITPDYPWIGSCLLFIAMVVCIFQLIRRMLGWLT